MGSPAQVHSKDGFPGRSHQVLSSEHDFIDQAPTGGRVVESAARAGAHQTVTKGELRRVAAVGHEHARVAARMRGEVVSDRNDR
jgi:hypothetical protein